MYVAPQASLVAQHNPYPLQLMLCRTAKPAGRILAGRLRIIDHAAWCHLGQAGPQDIHPFYTLNFSTY